ncbi:sensor histidine kinase [Cohnella hongkongensis]|uniref:Heme sensor protein HssS n=1 Tax=Cohnella hongkongensis TaxID=178337 RepID=A0ABV9FAK5_9BACL
MIKSLYVRVVLSYMIAVLIGLVSTYFLTLLLLSSVGDRYAAKLQSELTKDSEDIRELYRANGLERARAELSESRLEDKYEVLIYDPSGRMVADTDGNAPAELYSISNQAIRAVLNGETFLGSDISTEEMFIGLPYEHNGERYALFVQVSEQRALSLASQLLLFALAINLLVGGLIILVAARYIVKPLLGMKAAAERMAKGEFNIKLKWAKRKDELGQLANSINGMASQVGQLETMRQNFVSNVSHEIQSPLTSISGFSKALQQSGLTEEERSRYLTIIQNESERLSRLCDNLLKLASLDSQHHPFEPRVYDLDEQLRKAVVASEPQWSAKSLEWQLHLPKTKIEADEDQLSQVWVNLLGNAIKFTPEGGRIGVRIVQHASLVEVLVSDTGIGVPIAERTKVFERFYKADPSHNKKKTGSGLGLAIVKKIVIRHKGSVVLSGNGDGGTTVKVVLPHRID